jgi:hypothetical protein
MARALARPTFVALVLLCSPTRTGCQTPSNTQDQASAAIENDSNPTRPVLFSLRPELYARGADVTQAALIFRYDRAALRRRRWLPGERGVVLRFEMPLSYTQAGDSIRQTGLGDAYAQLLVAPYLTRTFAFVVGSGLQVPTASDDLLGSGKWILAPAAGPVWFFRGRGLLFVKLQELVSVAGDSRRSDVNTLLITPIFIHTVKERWWVLADSETRTNWLREGRTGVKSGLQIGRTIATGFGVWAKPEVWWGPNRDGRWNLKLGLVWYR